MSMTAERRLSGQSLWKPVAAGVATLSLATGLGPLPNVNIPGYGKPGVEQSQKAETIDIPWLPETVQASSIYIIPEAKKWGMDPKFPAIITTVESGGDHKATSHDERGNIIARGPMQVVAYSGGLEVARARNMPGAKEADPEDPNDPFIRWLGGKLLSDPAFNFGVGIEYLAMQMKEFGQGDRAPWTRTVSLTAAAYNGGPGRARAIRRGQWVADETMIYHDYVKRMWEERDLPESPAYNQWYSRNGGNGQRLVNAAYDTLRAKGLLSKEPSTTGESPKSPSKTRKDAMYQPGTNQFQATSQRPTSPKNFARRRA